MATDILTTSVATPPHPPHSHFPRSLAISDLDLCDDRYSLISPPRHVSPPTHQVLSSPNLRPSPTPFYPDAVHQAVRGHSLPPSNPPPYDLKNMDTPSLRLPSAKPDMRQGSEERRSTLHTDPHSTPLKAASPTSYPVDHVQPTISPPSMNEVNLQFFGPSQSSQASSGQLSKPPFNADVPFSTHHPRPLQPGPPWLSSLRDPHPTEQYIPSLRSAAPVGHPQSAQLSGPLPTGMRVSNMTQYSPAAVGVPVPLSSIPRAQPQQPTYINPSPMPNSINPVFTTQPLPPEEVCVECAMRDQDMADVDVTSPGIWARESDVQYEDLLRRELEEEEMGVFPQEQQRPRARGGRLTVANLKLWLTMNPKEPASKGEALERYVKTQQTLVEAEALAHARAALESRQLEDRMRDAYSQLRRSAYELGSSTLADNGVRVNTLRSSMLHLPSQPNGHSRDVTVLENGMIVEYVDVRKEERDERQQRRREEKRARGRKSSRGSAFDVSSMYSTMSPLLHAESGPPLVQSRSSTSRPMSVSTSLIDTFTRSMQSNPSVEALSMVSVGASPRRTRFFGARNLTPSFRSSDSLAPSGFSGSMVDMHLALHPGGERLTHSPVESNDRYQIIDSWRDSSALIPQRRTEQKSVAKSKKKKGLAKIWSLVTGTSKHDSGAPLPNMSQTRSLDGVHDDDYPLTPPPPLSYLVSRGSGDNGGPALRHVSTSSLPSSASPNYPLSPVGMSPPTEPSSLLPSPTSLRPVVITDLSESRKVLLGDPDTEQQTSPVLDEDRLHTQRGVHPTTSEPDLRHRASQVFNSESPRIPRIPTSVTHSVRPSTSPGWRDKTLPPLPGEIQLRPPTLAYGEPRPRTLSSFDLREIHGEPVPVVPQAPFARADVRRQSFNGLGNLPSGRVTGTLPARRPGFDPEKYGVFGGSHNYPVPASAQTQQPPKRKSKFGFASLLGRRAVVPVQDSERAEFPLGRSSGSEARHEAELGMHYGELMSNAGTEHTFPRMSMSVMTRKNLESLVDQSPDFVAYRYPSGDQSVHLLS